MCVCFCVQCYCALTHIPSESQLFKRRNVDMLSEEAAMFESPLVDSYLNSPVTVSSTQIAPHLEPISTQTHACFLIHI